MSPIPSMLQIDADIDIPEFYPSAKVARSIVPVFPPGLQELSSAVTKLSTNYPGIELKTSGRLELALSPSEFRPSLPQIHKNGDARPVQAAIPRLEWPTRADPILTDSIRRLLQLLWVTVVSRALQVHFPLHRTIVSLFDDRTEQDRKAILRLICNATATQAIAFWDSLEPDLRSWLDTLNENDRITFITRLGLRVHWL
jgi:hypothetical protein